MRPLVLVMSILVTLFMPLATPAGAATTDISVTTPADGRHIPGSVTPLLVTVTADGATNGNISIEFEGQIAVRQAFELPGGSSKQFVILTPTPPWGGGGRVIVDADGETQSERFTLQVLRNEEAVGVLPDLAGGDLADRADLTVDIGEARLFAFDTTLLDHGPGTLSVFTYVAASSDDLASLDDRQLDALFQWVSGGGRLVVDDAVTSPLPGRFADLASTSPDAEHPLGLGRVRFTDGAIDEGGFDGLLGPTASTNPNDMPFGGFFGGFPASSILASDAGVRVPDIGTIVILLLVYVVVAGPLAYVFLRQGNREPVLWVAVPALAALATGGVWVMGQQLRDNVTAAHGTLVVDLPAGQLISTQTLVSSPNGGWSGVELPAGWQRSVGSFEEQFMAFEFGAAPQTLAPELRGDDLVVDLPPGGISVINAESSLSPGALDRAWELDLRLEEGRLVGTITNLTPYELRNITVTAGRGIDRIGTLEAGAGANISILNPGGLLIDGDPLMESMFNENFERPNSDSPVNPSILSTWMSQHRSVRDPGNVVVLGWTRDAPAPLRTDAGREIPAGRTGFMAVETLTDAGTTLDPGTHRVEVLRGFEGTNVVDPARGFDEFPLTVRVTPATTTSDDPIVIDVPGFVSAMDVWDGAEWLPMGIGQLDDREQVTIAVPPNALADGSLYFRVRLGEGWWGARNPLPELRIAHPDEVIRAPGLLTDEAIAEASGTTNDGGESGDA